MRSRTKFAGVFVFCAVAMLANVAAAAETISDANFGFSFVFPDGFSEIARRGHEGRLHRVFVRISTEDLAICRAHQFAQQSGAQIVHTRLYARYGRALECSGSPPGSVRGEFRRLP